MSNNEYNCELKVEGMHCAACELTIEKFAGQISGVQKADAVLSKNILKLEVADGVEIAGVVDELNQKLADTNYRIVDQLSTHVVSGNDLLKGFIIAAVIAGIFILLQRSGVLQFTVGDSSSLPFAFGVGIVASLSSCMAVVGGLVLTISSSYAKLNVNKTKPLILFHAARLVGFFVLGGLIGVIGSAFTLSPISIFVINLILFVVMMIMGVNMLDVIPALRKYQLKMPKAIAAKGVNQHNVRGVLTPVLLGAITFFLPCGFTQAMQVYSLTTGSFISGALTMFVFALGTLPALALVSFASVKLSKGMNSTLFFKAAAFLILFFAVFNFLGALVAIGWIRPIFNF